MAVVAPPPFHNKLDFWGPGNSTAYPLETSEELMTDIMSYQYPPPPPPNGAEMGIPSSGYMPEYAGIPPPSAMDMRSGQDDKDRRGDDLSKAMKLKRSLSTPTVRPQQPPTQPQSSQTPEHSALGLAAEKRRNKLGYHRTSVACGHCRRRKIRCIPSPADVQGRCVNCIRLKKECSFYPVDQQPPADARQKSASRSSVGPKIASASSSPAIPSGHPTDMHGQQHYPQLTMPSIQTMAPPSMKPPGTDNYPSETKSKSTLPVPSFGDAPKDPSAKRLQVPSSASSTRTFDYGHPGINWMSSDPSPSSSKPGDLSATWRTYPQESPLTPAFSPFTPHAPPPSATWSTAPQEPASREEMSWSSYPPPPRSMSFGSESMSSHHPQQYPPISHMTSQAGRHYDRKSGPLSAEMYPPPISTTIPGVESIPGTTLEHNVSLSAGAVPPSNYGTWQQPYPYSKPGESYAGWYGENGNAQPMGSEEHVQQPPNEGQQPGSNMYYAGR